MDFRFTTLDDPELIVYSQLKSHRSPTFFVGEGRLVTERMLQSDYPVHSVLISQRKREWARNSIALIGDVPVYVVSDLAMEQLVGFSFHSGILSAGIRGEIGPTLEQLSSQDTATFLALPHLDLAENLGSIIRSARALGCAGLLLDQRAPDALGRRVLRVSMGHAMFLPCFSAVDLLGQVQRLKVDGFQVTAVEHHDSMVPLSRARATGRQVLVLGNEFEGVSPDWLELADQIVGIPMQAGVDSLNVAVTAAIVMQRLCQVRVE